MQVNLAYQELDYGQVNRVEDLLAATAPLPGEKDFRGFEWFALWEAIHKDIFHLKGNSPIGGITFLDDGHTLAILETHDMKESAQEVCLIKFYDLLTERETGSRMVPIGHG